MLDRVSIEKINHPKYRKVFIGLSGGVDSVVMLDLVHKNCGKPIFAIHVNHDLNEKSEEAQLFCVKFAGSYTIKCLVAEISVQARTGVEAAARKARYEAFKKFLGPEDLLLLAHHSGDQLETALFKLFRGGGGFGLNGMPRERAMGVATLYRPMLPLSKVQILRYASENQLKWIEDPTNQDETFDRNYIRHNIVPVIKNRFVNAEIAVLNKLESDSSMRLELETQAKENLLTLRTERDAIELAGLKSLEKGKLLNLLIFWLLDLSAPIPRKPFLLELAGRISSGSRIDMTFSWLTFKNFKGRLYVGKKMPAFRQDTPFPLQGQSDVAGGQISRKLVFGQGLKSSQEYQVRFRKGGEIFKFRGNKRLKKLLQEVKIPPWHRLRLPLIYADNELVALSAMSGWDIPMVIADGWMASPDSQGFDIDFVLRDRFK